MLSGNAQIIYVKRKTRWYIYFICYLFAIVDLILFNFAPRTLYAIKIKVEIDRYSCYQNSILEACYEKNACVFSFVCDRSRSFLRGAR